MTTPSLTDAQLNAIADALRAGNKIQAVKLYRQATGLGLKESKDEIEAIQDRLREKFPDQFPAKGQGKGGGCLGLIVVVLATGGTGMGWWLSRG